MFPLPKMFQSPSLRGSGRFFDERGRLCATPGRFNPLHCGAVVASRRGARRDPEEARFNPLHCGAVVASRGRATPRGARLASFQSPSLRGSGRFAAGGGDALRDDRVSIPFIAGQWSLQEEQNGHSVSAAGVSIPFIAGQWSLPLPELSPSLLAFFVSIPFIAGQWSLPKSCPSF